MVDTEDAQVVRREAVVQDARELVGDRKILLHQALRKLALLNRRLSQKRPMRPQPPHISLLLNHNHTIDHPTSQLSPFHHLPHQALCHYRHINQSHHRRKSLRLYRCTHPLNSSEKHGIATTIYNSRFTRLISHLRTQSFSCSYRKHHSITRISTIPAKS